mgnify:FL=1
MSYLLRIMIVYHYVKGVFIQNLDSILSEMRIGQAAPLSYKKQFGHGEKTIDGKLKEDIVFYELGRFIELLLDNNPNILELLSSNEDCIIYKHPILDKLISDIKNTNILTKKCYYTFYNYAHQQIKKATGLNKKINNPIDKEIKTPIDFCYTVNKDDTTTPLRIYLDNNKLDQRMCGLVKIQHAKDLYGLYYDFESAKSFSRYVDLDIREEHRSIKRMEGDSMGLGYKGIIKENGDNNIEVSNDIRLSSIPESERRVTQISYNKDAYLTYCKDYTTYWGKDGWINNRSEERYNDNVKSGQNYDGKNLSHCLRLLYMANEIANGYGVIVKRNEIHRKELLEVKKGVWSYEDIINKCNELTDGLEEQYKNSDLPDEVNLEKMVQILLEYRKLFYNLA